MPSRRVLLAALSFLSFAAVFVNVVMSPVLVEIAREFGVTTGTAGLLVAAYGLPGIVVGLILGPLSDRYGRRLFLIWGTVVMSVLTLAGVFATSFVLLLGTRVLAGIGASVIFPNSNATVGDAFPYRERGRAMSTIIGANTFATTVGVPLAGIVAEALTWRVSIAMSGLLGIAAAVVLWRALPPSGPEMGRASPRALYGRILGDSSARAAVLSSLLGAMFWFTWITYVVAFFQHTFGLSEGSASVVVLTTGVGALVGSQIGGRLGDRIGHRPIVGWSIAIAGVLLFLEANAAGGLVGSVALNFLVAAASGARFATNTALLTELAPEARGTMLAVNSSIVSLGIVAGTSIGGVLIDRFGFAALGAFSLAAAIGSAIVVWRYVNESAAEMAAGEAIE